MPHRGYIALWRKSLDSRIFHNEGLWKVWTWCLLKASHKKRWTSLKTGRGIIEIEILPGQFVFGRNSAAKELKMVPSTVWKRIVKLKNLLNLNIESNKQYSIINIINWDIYQIENNKSNSKSNMQVTCKEHASDTDNNVDNVDNEKKMSDSIEYRLANYLLNFILKRNPNHKKPNIQSWAKHIDLMLRIDKRKVEDVKAVIKWCQNDTPDKQPEGTWKGWANNILSTEALRKQFDKLVLKMQENQSEEMIKSKQPLTKKEIDKLNE